LGLLCAVLLAAVDLLAAAPPPGPSEGKWRALPYLQGYRPAQDLPLVVEHDPAAVAPGLNLYLSGHAAEAVLMDRRGRTLHRWRQPLRRLWPQLAAAPDMAKLEYWRRARLYPNGDLLAIYEGLGIVKLDSRSRVLWARRGGFHHDLEVAADGRIWVLDRPGRDGMLEDFVAVLEPDGRMARRIPLLRAFERSRFASLLGRMERAGDVFHTNTLEILGGDRPDPVFRQGNVLLSVLKLDALAVLDPEREEIVWAATGSWRRQHQPTQLGDGGLLLFDNLGAKGRSRRFSRVIELDPRTLRVRWQYAGLYSKTLGSCQRLPNGNTLITESEAGRALEVTREGRVVWEFHNPHRAGAGGKLVAVLFEMIRLPENFLFPGSLS
jgi:hypothetical protein